MLLAAAKKVEAHCDAVDINFGCPQGIAKRGNYGAFLQDDWDLIQKLGKSLLRLAPVSKLSPAPLDRKRAQHHFRLFS